MKVSVCAVIKNEHRYLEEWMKHHYKMGVDLIVLFEDGGDSHKAITDKYKGKCILLRNEKDLGNDHHQYQQLCYQLWFQNMGCDEVCFFIDLDEYLTFGKGYGMKRLVNEIKKLDTTELPIFWRMFNANGHWKRPKKSTIKAYTEESTYENWPTHKFRHNSKAFVYKKKENADAKFVSIHHVMSRTEDEYEALFEKYKDKVRLNHYYTRSYEDWCEKKARGGFREAKVKENDIIFFKHNPNMEGHMPEDLK